MSHWCILTLIRETKEIIADDLKVEDFPPEDRRQRPGRLLLCNQSLIRAVLSIPGRDELSSLSQVPLVVRLQFFISGTPCMTFTPFSARSLGRYR